LYRNRRHVIKLMHLRRAQAATEIEYDHVRQTFVLVALSFHFAVGAFRPLFSSHF
jgi:hypothetical protein